MSSVFSLVGTEEGTIPITMPIESYSYQRSSFLKLTPMVCTSRKINENGHYLILREIGRYKQYTCLGCE